MENKLIIFGGTKEGKELANFCDLHDIKASLYVATDYGKEVLEEYASVEVQAKRLDMEEMLEVFEREPCIILDATHPFAKLVSQNIQEACGRADREYIRVERGAVDIARFGKLKYRFFDTQAQVAAFLKEKEGNIFLSTGSKEVGLYADLSDRIYVRVIPDEVSLQLCADAGIAKSNILAMQGPFSKAFNKSLMREYDIRYMVTKESGAGVGYEEKLQACEDLDIEALIVQREIDSAGISLEDAFDKILEISNNKRSLQEVSVKEALSPQVPNKKIVISGVGPGALEYMTVKTQRLIQGADLIIASRRLIEDIQPLIQGNANIKLYAEYVTSKIIDILNREKEARNIVLLMSGDTGFFSGCKKLYEALVDMQGAEVEILPAISSFSYMTSLFHIPQDELVLMSLHTDESNFYKLTRSLKRGKKVFTLTTGREQIQRIAKGLQESGLHKLRIYLGENLSYENAFIKIYTLEELLAEERVFDTLVSLIIENEGDVSMPCIGIADDEFVRDKAPMTKENIRILSVAKLGLTEESVCYDIGAGTGSVTIEMANIAKKVYAIEKKEDACALIKKNMEKFQVSNIEVHAGMAMDIMGNLETPSHVFIGGSSGTMKDMVDFLYERNPDLTLVMTGITLETIADMNEIIKEYKSKGYDTELVWASIANAKFIANYSMMMGQNPVLIGRIRVCKK